MTMLSICTIVFLVSLFEFAESGFFSVNGQGKFLMVASFLIKLLLGVRLLFLAYSGKQQQVERLFAEVRAEKGQLQNIEKMESGQGQWKMETIEPTTSSP